MTPIIRSIFSQSPPIIAYVYSNFRLNWHSSFLSFVSSDSISPPTRTSRPFSSIYLTYFRRYFFASLVEVNNEDQLSCYPSNQKPFLFLVLSQLAVNAAEIAAEYCSMAHTHHGQPFVRMCLHLPTLRWFSEAATAETRRVFHSHKISNPISSHPKFPIPTVLPSHPKHPSP